MANFESEIKDLRDKNNELVQKVQYWKMTAAQRENEKLSLMKEINELRLKLSKLRSTGGLQAQNLDTAIQAASEKALAHLVRASGEIAHTIDLAKQYMRDRQELEASSPRWSALGGTPTTDRADRVHRVPPTIMGGQSIQPVVALSRTLLSTSNTRATSRSPNQSRSEVRPVPMHMLQDVYIPLTRIDADRVVNNVETETTNSANTSAEDLGLEDSTERVLDDSQNMSVDDDFDDTRRLDVVTEDLEPEDVVETPTNSNRLDPLEGPSWLLDGPLDKRRRTTMLPSLEPDSTTGTEASVAPTNQLNVKTEETTSVSCAFTPTVRRRKRPVSSPHTHTHTPVSSPTHTPTHTPTRTPKRRSSQTYSPRPLSSRRNSNSGRVLKVLVAKMRLSEESPRASRHDTRFDAPSPNGATDTALRVSVTANRTQDQSNNTSERQSRLTHDTLRDDVTHDTLRDDVTMRSDVTNEPRRSDDSDSDVTEGTRSRRNRKVVTYKEKPLNRKMRR